MRREGLLRREGNARGSHRFHRHHECAPRLPLRLPLRPMFVHKSLAAELGPAITPFNAVDLVVEKSKPREDDDA